MEDNRSDQSNSMMTLSARVSLVSYWLFYFADVEFRSRSRKTLGRGNQPFDSPIMSNVRSR